MMWFIFLLMGCLAAYLLYLIPDWTWWNPFDSTRGLVSGAVCKESQRLDDLQAQDVLYRQQQNRVQYALDEKTRIRLEKTRAILDQINKHVDVPEKPRFFGGSELTKPHDYVEPLDISDNGDIVTGTIGTILTGVSPAPRDWLRRYPPKKRQ